MTTVFFDKICAFGGDYIAVDACGCPPEDPCRLARALLRPQSVGGCALVLLTRCKSGCRARMFLPSGEERDISRGSLACAALMLLSRGASCSARIAAESGGRTAIYAGARLLKMARYARAAYSGRACIECGSDIRIGRWSAV